jgi:hypothetical protein
MALSLSRAFSAMSDQASKFDRRNKGVADPELGLMSAEDLCLREFMLPGANTVRGARPLLHPHAPHRTWCMCSRRRKALPAELYCAGSRACAAVTVLFSKMGLIGALVEARRRL